MIKVTYISTNLGLVLLIINLKEAGPPHIVRFGSKLFTKYISIDIREPPQIMHRFDRRIYKMDMKFWAVLGRRGCREKTLPTAISM